MARDDTNPGPKIATRYRIALAVGVSLLVLSLLVSCIAAPFLFPLLQVVLLIPMLPAALFGLIGAWRRRWWLSLGLTIAALAVY